MCEKNDAKKLDRMKFASIIKTVRNLMKICEFFSGLSQIHFLARREEKKLIQ